MSANADVKARVLAAGIFALFLVFLLWAAVTHPYLNSGPPEEEEKLIVTAQPVLGQGGSQTVLSISVTDAGPSAITVTSVTINGTEIGELGRLDYGGQFSLNYSEPTLFSGETGVVNVTLNAIPASGTTSSVGVTTASGNLYPVRVTWP
jgi:hypothetical protein